MQIRLAGLCTVLALIAVLLVAGFVLVCVADHLGASAIRWLRPAAPVMLNGAHDAGTVAC